MTTETSTEPKMAIADSKSPAVTPAILPRQPDPTVSLEVDILILDYLAHNTTLACLEVNSPFTLSHNLSAIHAFLRIFTHRHPDHLYDDELQFRLQLLQFTALFTQRYSRNPSTPPLGTIKDLRAKHSIRARARSTHAPPSPASIPALAEEDLERNRAQVLHDLGLPAEDEAYEDAFYGTSECVSLLDLLPTFLTIVALRNRISDSQVNPKLVELAGQFMLQAFLEQVLVYGMSDGKMLREAMDEAFRWGLRTREHDGVDNNVEDAGEGESLIKEMFTDVETGEEIRSWTATREQIRACLQPFTADHFSELADVHPLRGFDADVREFLSALAKSMPLPVLSQLETGQLDGMSPEETAEFIRGCGLSLADFWKAPAGFKEPTGRNGEHIWFE